MLLKKHTSFIKIRYSETDQRQFVHHGNYAQYLELARIDWLSDLGISYQSMEDEGVILPVYNLSLTFKKPARFGDHIRVETSLQKIPTFRIIFDYEIYNQNDQLITLASSELIFLNKTTLKPIRCPQYILEKL